MPPLKMLSDCRLIILMWSCLQMFRNRKIPQRAKKARTFCPTVFLIRSLKYLRPIPEL